MTASWVRPAASSVAFVFAFGGWLVRMWPTFTESFAAQVYVLVSCAAIGFVGAWLASLIIGVVAPKIVAAREQIRQARRDEATYRELTTIADVVGVLRPGVDR